MFPDLPEHLQALNALPGNTPPSNGMNQEQEEAFWGFLHADELFANFGNAPVPSEQQDLADDISFAKQIAAPAPTPVAQTPSNFASSSKDKQEPKNTQTLESFIAAYIGQSATNGAASSSSASTLNAANVNNALSNFLMPLPPSTFNPVQTPSSAPTPVGLPPSEVFPGSASTLADSPEEGRVSGAKKLKSLGAGQVEIEEDKRRRNTEASARFRAKKKEREQALEQRAKELEAQLAALQSENTSLENENRLLKAIVLNGASGSAPTSSGHNTSASLQATLALLGQKRKRDE
ncbi:hypothetical protein IAU60_001748 [Kwoniella sp. DSM 27419]